MADGFPGLAPAGCAPTGGHRPGDHTDGKAQVTREPTGHPEADGAGAPRVPRVPGRACRFRPLSRAATGPLPRAPVTARPPDDDPWSGTAPGFEFERRRSRPPRPALPPGQPAPDACPGRPRPPARRSAPFPVHADGRPARLHAGPAAGLARRRARPARIRVREHVRARPRVPAPSVQAPRSRPPVQGPPVRARSPPAAPDPRPPGRPAARRPGQGGRAPSGPGWSARCCPSRPSAAGPGSS